MALAATKADENATPKPTFSEHPDQRKLTLAGAGARAAAAAAGAGAAAATTTTMLRQDWI